MLAAGPATASTSGGWTVVASARPGAAATWAVGRGALVLEHRSPAPRRLSRRLWHHHWRPKCY
jgi:hypothetical protein